MPMLRVRALRGCANMNTPLRSTPPLLLLLLLLLLLPAPFCCFASAPSSEALLTARALPPPPLPSAVADGEHENADYFETHGELLKRAWKQFGTESSFALKVSEPLADACASARAHPSNAAERDIRELFTPRVPGVLAGNVLTTDAVQTLRRELQRVAHAGLPVRRPNGMNRHGVILDANVNGAVSNGLDVAVSNLVREFVRPLAQTLFPDIVGFGDASDFFAFTVRYNVSGENGDVALAEHRDASVVTLNLNLNTPEEFASGGLEGSSLYFVDTHDPSVRHNVELKPGEALFHRGKLRHAAQPLTGSGVRENLIIWLFGQDGWVRDMPYAEEQQLSPKQRWRPTSRWTDPSPGLESTLGL